MHGTRHRAKRFASGSLSIGVWFKLNFDAAVMHDKLVFAVVCRNWEGQLVAIHSRWPFGSCPIKGEALAARLASTVAGEFRWIKLLWKGMHKFLSPDSPIYVIADWIIEHDVQAIKARVQLHPNWLFSWIPREANSMAHLVANGVFRLPILGILTPLFFL